MKKILTTIFSIILISHSLSAQIPSSGLIGNYPFSGNANDVSGNANNGTVYNATLTTDRFGNANSAYLFVKGATNQNYIQCPQLAIQSTSFTVSLWAKWNTQSVNTTDYFMCQGTASNLQGFQFLYNLGNNTAQFDFYNSATYSSSDQSFFKDNNWHNLIGVYDMSASTVNIYVDGALQGTGTNKQPYTGLGNFYIGRASWSTTDNFSGSLDDILVYNRVLTSTEISNIYSDGYCKTTVTVMDTLMISSTTGINSIQPDFGTVKIYPNPSTSLLNIAMSKPSNNYTLNIYNSTGTEVYSAVLNTSLSQINLSSLGSSGLYIIRIYDSNNNILDTRKLIYE